MPRIVDEACDWFVVVKRADGRFIRKHVDSLKAGDEVVLRDLTLSSAYHEAEKLNYLRRLDTNRRKAEAIARLRR